MDETHSADPLPAPPDPNRTPVQLTPQVSSARAVMDPDWLTQHGGRLLASKDGRSWLVYLGDEPQYLLMPTPVKGQFGCRISQTINGCRLDSDGLYPSHEDAVKGGLEDLRKALGW